MTKVNILGVEVNSLTQEQFKNELEQILQKDFDQSLLLATTYSEFIVAAQTDFKFREILNQAYLNVADGIGVLWAASFLARPYKNLGQLFIGFIQSAWQTAFEHKAISDIIPQRISGADIVWDILSLAQKNNQSVFLLGTYGDIVSPIKARLPDLKIAGRHEGSPYESGLVEMINNSGTDVLLVAFGPIDQYKWLAANQNNLKVKLMTGLGGTFDYIMGRRSRAGEFWQSHGLEWLHRLFTQPWRWKRMWKAIIVFSWLVVKEKYKRI